MDEFADVGGGGGARGAGSGGGSNKGSSSVSAKGKGSKNKRKLADHPLEKQVNLPSSLTEFPRYESSPVMLSPATSQNSSIELVSLGAGSSRPKEGMVGKENRFADWDDLIVCQLEELLSSNLHTVFQSAIEKIAACGYSDKVAERAVSRHGLYTWGKDLVLSIVDDTLAFLKREQEIDASTDRLFEDLPQLVEYTMVEMINMLRAVKPSLSVPEAMWWLLICDLNISQACALNEDPSSGEFGRKEFSGESSSDCTLHQLKSEAQSSETSLPKPDEPYVPEPSLPDAHNSLPETLKFGSFPNLPNPRNPLAQEVLTPEKESQVYMPGSVVKSLGTRGESVQTTSQTSISEEKAGAGRKGRTRKEFAALRQKSFHMDKNYKACGSKGAFRKGNLATIGGFVVEKRLKSPPEISDIHMKIASSKTSMGVEVNAPVADGSRHVSVSTSTVLALPATSNSTLPRKGNPSTLPTTNTEHSVSSTSETKPAPKLEVSTSDTLKTPADYYAGIPYDESVGKYVPQDERDRMILKLVPRLQGVQKELQGWTEWANQKVMQAARRLSMDQAELKILRREKEEAEQFKKEKLMLEENTMKRLSEMESALSNANGQFEKANSNGHRLEKENSVLKKEMEAAKLRASESAANCQEAMDREKKTLKKAQSLEGQKGLLQEELETEKHKVAELQLEVTKAKNVQNRTEARWKQERTAQEKLLAQVTYMRKERERLEARAKAEEDMIRQKTENDMQKHKEQMNKLENQLSELKWKADCSRIAEFQRGINGSDGSCLADSKSASALKGNHNPKIFKRVANFRDNSGTGGLRQERECVMCLSEEISVVFLPCAHQVLCAKCNELHEKQAMEDCPSCRTPIQQRINAHYAHT